VARNKLEFLKYCGIIQGMNKKYLVFSFLLVLLAVGSFILFKNESNAPVLPEDQIVKDHKNISYKIDGKDITLVNGLSEIAAAPGSASTVVTKYFGNELRRDLDADGREDIVFMLTQETGGSGTFYYVAAALNKKDGYIGSDTVFLGDRIAPQSINIGKGDIIEVNYAERKPGEGFDVAPSVGKSIWLLLDPTIMKFGQVAQNFEGEADPSRMKLGMKTWDWVYTLYNDETKITPKATNKFTLTLRPDNTFSATTDCNGVGGKYVVTDSQIVFSEMMSTLMYCEGSQEADFRKGLENVQSFFFTSKGELVFNIKYDSGSMIFR
jgi:heat shock protein HslJ